MVQEESKVNFNSKEMLKYSDHIVNKEKSLKKYSRHKRDKEKKAKEGKIFTISRDVC